MNKLEFYYSSYIISIRLLRFLHFAMFFQRIKMCSIFFLPLHCIQIALTQFKVDAITKCVRKRQWASNGIFMVYLFFRVI